MLLPRWCDPAVFASLEAAARTWPLLCTPLCCPLLRGHFCVRVLVFALAARMPPPSPNPPPTHTHTHCTAGAFAERVSFAGVALYFVLFTILVYCPLAHMVWHPEGLIRKAGVVRRGAVWSLSRRGHSVCVVTQPLPPPPPLLLLLLLPPVRQAMAQRTGPRSPRCQALRSRVRDTASCAGAPLVMCACVWCAARSTLPAAPWCTFPPGRR
jgi:hypothetical protein